MGEILWPIAFVSGIALAIWMTMGWSLKRKKVVLVPAATTSAEEKSPAPKTETHDSKKGALIIGRILAGAMAGIAAAVVLALVLNPAFRTSVVQGFWKASSAIGLFGPSSAPRSSGIPHTRGCTPGSLLVEVSSFKRALPDCWIDWHIAQDSPYGCVYPIGADELPIRVEPVCKGEEDTPGVANIPLKGWAPVEGTTVYLNVNYY